MTQGPDDLDKLLADVRKTITDNRQFIDNLLDETEDERDEYPLGDEASPAAEGEDFEEL